MILKKNKIYKKCLLIGGAGFIGLQTAKILKNNNFDVAIIDNFSSSIHDNDCDEFQLFEIDASNIEELDSVYSSFMPDVVYIFSSVVDVPTTINDPLIVTPGVLSIANACELSKKYNVKLNVYASSGYVYGNQNDLPYKESDKLDPVNPYNISKIFGENFAIFYSKQFSVSTIIMRYAPTYGPRRSIGPIADFIKKAINGEPISIYGDVTRDYIFVEDVALANLLILDYEFSSYDIFNIGTSNEVNLKQVYKIICESLKTQGLPIILNKSKSNEINRFVLDTNKAKKLLNFTPKNSLKSGLDKTIDWIKLNET